MDRRSVNRLAPSLKGLAWGLGIVVLLVILLAVLGQHFYFLARIDPQEVGVRFRGGRITEVVGPGVYSDFALYADIKRVSSEAVSFSVTDPEVITLDRGRLPAERGPVRTLERAVARVSRVVPERRGTQDAGDRPGTPGDEVVCGGQDL